MSDKKGTGKPKPDQPTKVRLTEEGLISCTTSQFFNAIHAIHRGRVYFRPEQLTRMIQFVARENARTATAHQPQAAAANVQIQPQAVGGAPAFDQGAMVEAVAKAVVNAFTTTGMVLRAPAPEPPPVEEPAEMDVGEGNAAGTANGKPKRKHSVDAGETPPKIPKKDKKNKTP